jgi:hypothetical protein
MDCIKKHVDTVIILTAFGIYNLWINEKFNQIHLHLDFITRELEKIKVLLES